MDLSHINDSFIALGVERIDGVVGADVLLEGGAVIDYGSMILYLKSEE